MVEAVMPGTSPGMTKLDADRLAGGARPYALTVSGNTASILVFSVAALNGLTM
jgi:hypothetical protein